MSKSRRMPRKIRCFICRSFIPRSMTTLLVATALALLLRRFRKHEIYIEPRSLLTDVTLDDLSISFSHRKILSDVALGPISNADNQHTLANTSTKTSFYSLIPSKKLIAVSNQQAWVKILVPPKWKQQKLNKSLSAKFSRRRNMLRQACRRDGKVSANRWLETAQVITAPDRRAVVCYVQKAGSTSWHKLIYNLRHAGDTASIWSNQGHIENREYAKNLPDATKEILMRSPEVTRVLCVRHPFARLISGWNSKFHKNFVASVGNLMFKSMPGLARYVNKTVQHDKDHVISFEDFTLYLAENELEKADAHFKSVNQLCRPCEFPYDFIVKAESAPNDLWPILNRLNATMDDFLVHNANAMTNGEIVVDRNSVQSSKHETVFSAIVRHFFAKLPPTTTKALMELYREDFVRFGYTFDIRTLNAGGFQ